MDRSNEYDSHANLDDLIDRVERGEEVVISRAGKAVAKLTPIDSQRHARSDAAWDRLINFSSEHNTGRMTMDEIIAAKKEGQKN